MVGLLPAEPDQRGFPSTKHTCGRRQQAAGLGPAGRLVGGRGAPGDPFDFLPLASHQQTAQSEALFDQLGTITVGMLYI